MKILFHLSGSLRYLIIAAICAAPGLYAAEPRTILLPAEVADITMLHGIPFSQASGPRNLVPGAYPTEGTFSALVLAGMTTLLPEASDRWGMNEPSNAYQSRLFIGDRIGRVIIRYKNDTLEQLPILFGVNVWPYELYTPTRLGEEGLLTSHALRSGPYREPFASDPAAMTLLQASLRLLESLEAPKPLRYLMGIRVKPIPLKSITLIDEKLRTASWQVGAISGLGVGTPPPAELPLLDETYFIRQQYAAPARALAQRLYQSEDQLPHHLPPPVPSAGYPQLNFSGPPAAAILSHVFTINARDLIENKLTSEGRLCSSSPAAPNFGGYIGMGTWRNGSGQYAHHSWSRDAGPALRELLALGRDREARAAGEALLRYLYDADLRHGQPNWKRVINSTEIGEGESRKNQRAENDGHAAVMLGMAQLATSPAVDREWMDQYWSAFVDAGNWFPWQMDHPEISAFDGLLYNESESSGGGGYDLFSNSQAAIALRAFATLAKDRKDPDHARQWVQAAAILEKSIATRLTLPTDPEDPLSPRYLDTDTLFDSWTYGWKRMAPLLAAADLSGYGLQQSPSNILLLNHTYLQLRGPHSTLPDSGRTLGYGQAYLAQSALLLDQTADATRAVERAAAFCYHQDHPYLVPEGVIVHPDGRQWFRNGDLGNLMQQVEILKMIRLLPGIDDRASATGLTLIPRLPIGWSRIEAKSWPIRVAESDGRWTRANIDFSYERLPNHRYHLKLSCDREIPISSVRLGPFPTKDATLLKSATHAWRWEKQGDAWFAYLEKFISPLRQLDLF